MAFFNLFGNSENDQKLDILEEELRSLAFRLSRLEAILNENNKKQEEERNLNIKNLELDIEKKAIEIYNLKHPNKKGLTKSEKFTLIMSSLAMGVAASPSLINLFGKKVEPKNNDDARGSLGHEVDSTKTKLRKSQRTLSKKSEQEKKELVEEEDRMVSVPSILVRMQLTMSKFRRYTRLGVIVVHDKSKKDNRSHLFIPDCVEVRLKIFRNLMPQTILGVDAIGIELIENFGKDDQHLIKLLKSRTVDEVVAEYTDFIRRRLEYKRP